MNGDKFRPEEDLFKPYVKNIHYLSYKVFSSRRQKASGVGGSIQVTQKPWQGDPDEDFHWYLKLNEKNIK